MMPIVDAGVGLSKNNYTLQDYMDASKQFHVLRMIAVQQAVSDANWDGVQYLQAQALTRGSGGFPNAIIARVDLSEPEHVKALILQDGLSHLRGICCQLIDPVSDSELSHYKQSLEILVNNNLCLDLLVTSSQLPIVEALAKHQPNVTIIIDVIDLLNTDKSERSENIMEGLASVSKHYNVFLKICAARTVINKSNTHLEEMLSNMLTLFGDERIMFGSGFAHKHSNPQFDALWTSYVNACSELSARHRDNLFRSNAIRVYTI